jgi:hypothetical protein
MKRIEDLINELVNEFNAKSDEFIEKTWLYNRIDSILKNFELKITLEELINNICRILKIEIDYDNWRIIIKIMEIQKKSPEIFNCLIEFIYSLDKREYFRQGPINFEDILSNIEEKANNLNNELRKNCK